MSSIERSSDSRLKRHTGSISIRNMGTLLVADESL
jgi:hypothetical protein